MNRETDVGITPRVFYSKSLEVTPIKEMPFLRLKRNSRTM